MLNPQPIFVLGLSLLQSCHFTKYPSRLQAPDGGWASGLVSWVAIGQQGSDL